MKSFKIRIFYGTEENYNDSLYNADFEFVIFILYTLYSPLTEKLNTTLFTFENRSKFEI